MITISNDAVYDFSYCWGVYATLCILHSYEHSCILPFAFTEVEHGINSRHGLDVFEFFRIVTSSIRFIEDWQR